MMAMNKSKLMMYLHNPELLGDRDLSEIKELVDEYPCFQSVRMLYVKNLRNQGYSNYGKVLREAAVFVTNRTKLFFLLDERVIIKHDAEPSQKAVEEEVFDFGKMEEMAGLKSAPSAAEKAKSELDKLIDNEMTVQPYFGNLSDTFDLDSFKQTFGKKDKPAEQTKVERHAQLLDNFTQLNIKPITGSESETADKEPVAMDGESSVLNTNLMSDTLAQIYFKKGAYEQALRMYEKLCLKFPEKNSYFAARIREIKEIINNK
jgi:tetratricopeptide (TPR) repeat protein